MIMTEWPYVMFCEALVFALIGFGMISLQNTLTGVAYYSFPVLVTSMSVATAACWILGVAGLVLVVSMTTGFGDGVASVLLRGGRAACGIFLLHVSGAAGLCAGHSDQDFCVAVLSGNHVFAPDSSFMYYVFAVAFALNFGASVVCLLIAQHGTLAVIEKRSASEAVPRTAWNANLVLMTLFEVQAVLDHNITRAFATRQFLASWQTLVGIPTLLLLDMLCLKLASLRSLWSALVVLAVHLLVVGAWITLAFLSASVRSVDAMYVNATLGIVLMLCVLSDCIQIVSAARKPETQAAPKIASVARPDIFDIPVRAGSRGFSERRLRRATDMRSKKDI